HTTLCKPIFIQPISSCSVCSGETVRFQARVSAMPKPEILWFHNQQLMLPTKDIVFHFDESTGTAILIIVDAFSEHAGQYSCKARNSAGEATCTATLTVTAEGKAPFLQSSVKDVRESIQAKSEVHIASPFAKKETKIYVKEIKSVQEPSREMVVQAFGPISGTVKAAAGKEVEIHQTSAITQKSENTMVSTTSIQVLRETPPKILLKLHDLTVRCGDTAQFMCALESENFSDILWTHEGRTVQESERIRLSQNGSVIFLTILNVQLLDQGLYSCTIRNNFGEVTTTAILTIEGGYYDC
uniref:Ig-like domain-containing protein n=1 Tax=Varanus komodoensis TaxID=61221 RepID=A0A8D2KW64_VARKO